MRLLFAITFAAFCAVFWVALALARRLQRNQGVIHKPVRRPAAQEFFEAGEFRTPRALTLNQEIHQQRPRRTLGDLASALPVELHSSEPNLFASNGHVSDPEVLAPRLPRASFNKEAGRITRIDSRLHSILTATAPATPSTPAVEDIDLIGASFGSAPTQSPSHRILPSPDRISGLRRRVDLSHYTKDMGDLTDPSYNHSRQGSGGQGPASIHRRDR